MKNLKLILISMGLLCSGYALQAQSYAEGALLFSRTNPGGTARIQALGGAQISLGGDISLAGSNPAGLGMANRSSFTITGGLTTINTETSFYNTLTPDSRTNLNFPQIGLIINKPSRSGSKFKGGSLAINFNRINSYHKNTSYSAVPDNSIIDYFLEDVDGAPLNAFNENGYLYNTSTGLGWFTYLIDTIDNFYDSYILDFPESQSEEISTRGSHYQWSFSYGANYDDKLFFGAGLGFTNFRYESQKRFNETFDPTSPNYSIYAIDLQENLFINGTGINFSLGMIARPIKYLQVGLSYSTPTLYNINDEWDARIASDWDNYNYVTASTSEVLGVIEEQTEILISDYSLTSPSRFSVGATGFLGKYGFITADYEQVDYSKTRLNSRDFSMSVDNQEISSSFTKANTLRAGVELRYDIFRFRFGGSMTSSPYLEDETNSALDRSIRTISGGIGIRERNFFADVALVKSTTEGLNFPYFIPGIDNSAVSSINNVSGMLTVGFNF